MAMFGYMTTLEKVEMSESREIHAEGDDLESLLFHFLDEFLFIFSCEPFFIIRVSKNNFESNTLKHKKLFNLLSLTGRQNN